MSTLFGKPFNFRVGRIRQTLLRDRPGSIVISLLGVLTSLDPIRPTQLLARSLPRCGVDMKITRPISGRCLKMMRLFEEIFAFCGQLRLLGRLSKNFHP